MTLSFVHEHPRILLAMKKRGFGAGRWNGYGGKLEDGETLEEGLKRETKEEVEIDIVRSRKVGVLDFEFQGNPEILEVHIYKIDEYAGEPQETEEMSPQWFTIDEIPFKDMWPDDVYWFPLFLKDALFKGRFLFGENDAVLEYDLTEVERL